MISRIQEELNLEQEAIIKGVGDYHLKNLHTPLTEQTVGMRLLKDSIEPLVKAINGFKFDPEVTKGNKFSGIFRKMEIDSHEMAFIVLKGAMSRLSERVMLTRMCTIISAMLIDHYEYLKFKTEYPGYLHKMELDWQERGTSENVKRTAIKAVKKKLGIETADLTHEEKIMLGQKLVDLMITSTKLFEIVKDGVEGRESYYLVATEKTQEWIEHQHEMCEVMSPVYLPMIIPPKPWTNFNNGGYYSDNITLRNTLVKTRNKRAKSLYKGFSMPEVYSAINSIQKTAWRINTEVLEVLKEVWESGSTLGGLPSCDDLPLPAKAWTSDEEWKVYKELHEEAYNKWRRATVLAHSENKRQKGKRVNMITRIRMAEKFSNEPEIYYPHCLDFRGRLYPIPMVGGMHPQGDDSGKALLMFAEGKKLGERGLYWLRVHLANTYGYDKASFDDRVQWVFDHEAAILDSAENPLDGVRYWADADSPYCFLAACIDYKKAIENPDHESHIPVAMDGSCNGLQHFSAMLRDEVGGQEVNLVPRDKPADIYSKVAAHVSDIVMQEALSNSDKADVAKLWVGKIDRKMAKRNVMTLPYGAKKYGFKDQLMAELKDREKDYLDTEDHFQPAVYLADRMYKGIGDIVIAARNAMDWLQMVSGVVNEARVPISWTTPAGLLAYQEYQVQKVKQIDTFWGELKLRLYLILKLDTDKLDVRKQTTGISPNFVHSMDASALMLTVNRLTAKGIKSFAMIHDSYGVHAADVDILHQELREAFIQMYTDHDVLEEFRTSVLEQLPEELREKVPPVPPKGSLDLAQIRESRYFFA